MLNELPQSMRGIVRKLAFLVAICGLIAAPALVQGQTLDSGTLAALAAQQQANSDANTDNANTDSADTGNTETGSGAGGQANGSVNASVAPYSPVSISGSAAGATLDNAQNRTTYGRLNPRNAQLKPPAKPSDFQVWLEQVTGRKISRFGSDLLLPSAGDFIVPATTTVPPDYALNIGDVVSVSMTGSVEGSADFQIDRDGRIYLPNVGSVSLIGVRYRDLKDRIAQAIGLKYRGFEVSVSLAKLHGIRVYVTGFANKPGSYTVNSLSTLVSAVLAAGGPSAGGSFRSVELIRNGQVVEDFDLYDLLRHGDRSHDPVLQNEDVLFIPPVGKQVAVVGSVNDEAIYEARAGDTVEEMLELAGGPTNLAEPSRLILYRLSDRDTVGSRELTPEEASHEIAQAGDIIQVLPEGSLTRPLERQQVVVRIEGEVNRPGNYYVAPNTPLSKVVQMAGGLTGRAYVFGTEFSRVSVREQQRQAYHEAIEQMESLLAAAPLSNQGSNNDNSAAQMAAARAFINQLRQKEPTGRMVLNVTPGSAQLPGDILLENNDQVLIPPRIDTVGVYGAVYRPASFLMDPSHPKRVKDYLEEAGGAIPGADRGHIFVVRASGAVLTKRRGALSARVLPGDAIFVPIRTRHSTLLEKIRDISTILFSFGLSAAAVAAIN
jgi:protein involved in polysaccharide export with SLBB domain